MASRRPAKRARISLACISCREQKTRCDGEKPRCGSCQRKDPDSQIPCVYQNQAKVRESKQIQKLLQQINHLEGKLAVGDHRNRSSEAGRSGTHSLPRPNIPQPLFHRRNTIDGPVLDDYSTPHVAESERIVTENIEQSLLQSPPNGGGDRRSRLSDSSLSQPRMGSEALHERSSINLQHLNNPGDQYASGNVDTSNTMLPRYDESQEADAETPKPDNGPYFYANSSNTALMQEVHDIISPVTGTDQESDTDLSKGEPSIYSTHRSNDGAEDIIRSLPSNYLSFQNQMNFFELPPRSLADHLIDCYFSRVHLLYPFLHRPTFEAAYEKLWAPADQRNGNNNGNACGGGSPRFADAGLGNLAKCGTQSRVFHAGMNAIFALSCQFSDLPIPKAREIAKVYLDRAMSLFLDIDQFDFPTLSLVQVLLLLCLHLQGTPFRNRLWNIMGMASRIAQGLGLQLEGTENGRTKTTLEIEMRRRTWYSCVMLDLTISTTLGRQAMTSSGFTTPFPQAIDDENLSSSTTSSSSTDFVPPQVGISLTSFFVEAIKLWELNEEIAKALYPDATTRRKVNNIGPVDVREYSGGGFDVLVKLETEWNRIYANLPQELRWAKAEEESAQSTGSSVAAPAPATETKPRWLVSQQNVLHTRFLYVKLLIYRPLFLRVHREKIPHQMKAAETQMSPHNSGFSGIGQGPTTIQSHFATRFATECFQTAEELLVLIHKLHLVKGANAWWYNIFYAYFTGVVVILSRFCPPLTEVLGIPRIDESWVLCQNVLNNMVIHGNHAKKCLASLQALRSRLAAWESGSAKSLQNLPAVLDHVNNVQSTSNVYDQNPTPMTMHNNAQFGAREGRTDVPFALGNVEFEASDDWAGALPWDADMNNWWTYELVGEDLGLTPAFEPPYL